MLRYEVIPHKVWQNKLDPKRQASIYGAGPYTSSADEKNWEVVDKGFTIRDNYRNTVGMCRPPWKTKEEAQKFIDEVLNNSEL